MTPVFESNAPFFVAILVAVGIVFSRWLLWNCSNRKPGDSVWKIAVVPLVGVAIGAVAVLYSYHSEASDLWVARFGIKPVWNSPRLYWGALVEILRIGFAFGIYVRTLAFVFHSDLQKFFESGSRMRLLVIDVLSVAALLWISVYTFDPSYGPNSLLVETENKMIVMQEQEEKLDTESRMQLNSLKHIPILSHIPEGKSDLNNSVSFEESSNRFVRLVDVEKLKLAIEESKNDLKTRHLELLSELNKSGTGQKNGGDAKDGASSSGNPELGLNVDQDPLRNLVLEKIFHEQFYLNCEKPYIYYGVYSVLAFVCITLPMFLVPVLSLSTYWRGLSHRYSELKTLRQKAATGDATHGQDDGVKRKFDECWKLSKEFVERFGELPLLCAGLVAFELAYGSQTLSQASLKISMVAAVCIMLLSFIGLGAALLVETARKQLDDEVYPWAKERNIKKFLDEIRSDSFVGTVATFVGGSLVVGILMQVLRLFGT